MKTRIILFNIFMLYILNITNCASTKLKQFEGKVKILPGEQKVTLKLFNLCKPIPLITPFQSISSGSSVSLPKYDVMKYATEVEANIAQPIYSELKTVSVKERQFTSSTYTTDTTTKTEKYYLRFWKCSDKVFQSLGKENSSSKGTKK